MFKYSFNSTTLRNMEVIEALKAIRTYGYAGVELTLNDSHLHPLKSNMARLPEIKKFCSENDFPVVCVAAGGDRLLGDEPYEPSLICPQAKGRSERLDLIKRAMEITVKLESPVLNINSGKLKAEMDREKALGYLYENLEELLRESSDVILVLEPEPGFLIGTTANALAMIHRISHPRLRLNLDIGHVFCSEEDCYSAIERAIPYAGNIHIEDIRGRIHHHEIPGEGDIDFVRVLNILKNSGYNHYVGVELHHHADMWQGALKESLEYLTKIGA